MQTNNLLDFCYPGLYEIKCYQANRSYFGHSKNVLYRLGRHYNDLDVGCHDCFTLQQDWHKFGRQEFVFRVLVSGPEWKEKKKRLVKELEYITKCPHRVYNQDLEKVPTNRRKEWTIDGVRYSSGAEAARKLGKSPSSIYRLMKRKGDVKTFFGSKRISIDGQEFPSITQAMSVLGIAKSTLYRRLRSPKYEAWFFVKKTRSNDYPERE